MPSSILSADAGFPTFTQGQSTEQKISVITNYLYMLLEQLRYSLNNISVSNFNEAELNSITDPIYQAVSDTNGNLSELRQQADEISTRVEDNAGNISSLVQRADTIETTVGNQAGDISKLVQRADTIESTVGNQAGEISDLVQRADSIESTVGNQTGEISKLKQTAESFTTFVGAGGDFTMLKQTVDAFTFTDSRGQVKISDGCVTLSGCIGFSDYSSGVQSAIDKKLNSADLASNLTPYMKKDSYRYITETCIDARSITSPVIMGGIIAGATFRDLNNRYDLVLDADGRQGFLVTRSSDDYVLLSVFDPLNDVMQFRSGPASQSDKAFMNIYQGNSTSRYKPRVQPQGYWDFSNASGVVLPSGSNPATWT